MYPTTRNYIDSPIGGNWANFLNTAKITNQDYKELFPSSCVP